MGRLYHNGQPVVNINHGVADSSDATAIASDILATKTAYINNQKATGTMPNNGAVSQALNAGESYTIPYGYHNGSGEVTANSLASQTQGTATASDIAMGLTAWVNGTKLTGTKEGATATITVTYDSSFYNKTMTCTKGTKTYTKTTTSSGSTTFSVAEGGTWTITCNGVSRTVDVVLEYSTQMAITKTVTVYSAASDTVSFTDATGAKTVTTNTSGRGSVTITFIPPSANITFTSSVAKNPSNLSQNYSKNVSLTTSTTEIYIMPDGALYWWGYGGINQTTTSWGTLTENTRDISFTGSGTSTTKSRAFNTTIFKDVTNYSKCKMYATVSKTGSQSTPRLDWGTTPTPPISNDNAQQNLTSLNGVTEVDISSYADNRCAAFYPWALAGVSGSLTFTIYAIWYE